MEPENIDVLGMTQNLDESSLSMNIDKRLVSDISLSNKIIPEIELTPQNENEEEKNNVAKIL